MENNKSNYQSEVASIRRAISKYSKVSVLDTSLRILQEAASARDFQTITLSHIIFLILKWAGAEQLDGNQKMTAGDLNKIANRVFSLQSLASDLESTGPLELKIRPMIKQQFATQIADKEEFLALARQLHWFSHGSNCYFGKCFEDKTGIELKAFFFISVFFSLLAFDSKEKDLLKIDIGELVHKLTPHVEAKSLVNFLKLTGVSVGGLHEFLAPLSFKDHPKWEYFQETPFIKKPIILHDGFVFLTNTKLWHRSMSYFVSDLLKTHFGQEFKVHFGTTFERYVEDVLKNLNVPYLTEAEINSRYTEIQKYKKSVDFLVEDDCRIFIDAKAIEPNDFVSTCMDQDGLSNRLKGSYIHAIWQGQECCFNVRRWDDRETKENFQIVVIHQEHFLNNAVTVERLLVPELSKEIEKQFGDIPIPLENIYYLTICDFERLVRHVSDSGESISKFLIRCRDLDSDPSTSSLLFRMHLDRLDESFNDRNLIDFTQSYLNDFHRDFEKNIQYWSGKIDLYVQTRKYVLSNVAS